MSSNDRACLEEADDPSCDRVEVHVYETGAGREAGHRRDFPRFVITQKLLLIYVNSAALEPPASFARK
jgi:hypothetical protein